MNVISGLGFFCSKNVKSVEVETLLKVQEAAFKAGEAEVLHIKTINKQKLEIVQLCDKNINLGGENFTLKMQLERATAQVHELEAQKAELEARVAGLEAREAEEASAKQAREARVAELEALTNNMKSMADLGNLLTRAYKEFQDADGNFLCRYKEELKEQVEIPGEFFTTTTTIIHHSFERYALPDEVDKLRAKVHELTPYADVGRVIESIAKSYCKAAIDKEIPVKVIVSPDKSYDVVLDKTREAFMTKLEAMVPELKAMVPELEAMVTELKANVTELEAREAEEARKAEDSRAKLVTELKYLETTLDIQSCLADLRAIKRGDERMNRSIEFMKIKV